MSQMEANFKKFTAIRDTVEAYGSFCTEGAFDWAKEFFVPKVDLDLPTVSNRGKITTLIINRNPIIVRLDNGSTLFFSLDEFRRIKGKPAVGRVMAYSMLRLPHDGSAVPSKIQSCEVI